jgi:hypothetical protein
MNKYCRLKGSYDPIKNAVRSIFRELFEERRIDPDIFQQCDPKRS